MREEIPTETNDSDQDVAPLVPNGLVKWIWPALGSLSIGAIVVMILQSPELSSKLGIAGFSQPKQQAVVKLTTRDQKPPTPGAAPALRGTGNAATPIQNHTAPAGAPVLTGKTQPSGKKAEAPSHQLDQAQIAAITTRLKDQAVRIKKLETIVGAVTGSVGSQANGARSGGVAPSSSMAKKAPATNTADVDTTHKSDSLNIPVMPKKIKTAELEPVSKTIRPAPMPDHTGDTHAAARSPSPAPKQTGKKQKTAGKPVKVAALVRPGSPEEDLASGGQYGIRLVIADKVSKLKTAWKKLGKKRKGNELAGLKTRVQKSKATNGKTIYALVAGPLPDMGEAIELCVRLKLKGIPCAQSDFTGEPL